MSRIILNNDVQLRGTKDMKVIPLNDKILVKRVEAEEKTAGGKTSRFIKLVSRKH